MPLTGPELAGRVFDALNRADLDAFLDLTDPGVEFNSLIAEADSATFHGHEGVRDWWEKVQEALGGLTYTVESVREPPELDDFIVTKLRVHGEVSGVRIEQVMWQCARRRGDKAVWWRTARSEDEVMAAAREAASNG